MDAEEIQNWVAYYSLQNDEYRKSIDEKMHVEKQMQMSDNERASQLRSLFGGSK